MAVESLNQAGVGEVTVVGPCRVTEVLLRTVDDQQTRRGCGVLMGHLPDREIPGKANEHEATAAGCRVRQTADGGHELSVETGLAELRVAHVGKDFAEASRQPGNDGCAVGPAGGVFAFGSQAGGLAGESVGVVLGGLYPRPKPEPCLS